jgi:hypothetical protein
VPEQIAPANRAPADVTLPAPPVAAADQPRPQQPAAESAGETGRTSPSSVSTSNPDLPQVTAILTSDERRIALVDGRIVRVGDTVGRWRVTAIDPRYVVFLDVSGAELRVPLR